MHYSQICQIIILCLRTKKQAKHLCAQQALDSFVQFRDTSDGTYVSSMTKNTLVRKECSIVIETIKFIISVNDIYIISVLLNFVPTVSRFRHTAIY